jgi:hypothetical protein
LEICVQNKLTQDDFFGVFDCELPIRQGRVRSVLRA